MKDINQSITQLNNISVSYPDHSKPFFKRIMSKKDDRFWALQDISFEVRRGEVLGVLGRNGSGKSTLLKLLTGLISQDSGEYFIRSKSNPVLLTLGAGFQSNLSGYNNIILNGLYLGYTRKEIERRIEEIIDFSELGDFIFKPVRTYSSGMKSRLGFSVAITLDPEILLIDEVLGVGDMAFQEKCKAKMHEKINAGKTVIIVAHSTSLIRNVCERAVWIHQGKQEVIGETKEVLDLYTQFMKGSKK